MSDNEEKQEVVAALEVGEPKVGELEVAELKVEEPKVEELKVESDTNEDIFITENDTFDVVVKWYKSNNNIFANIPDTPFDEDFDNINEFTVKFKYPSQGDYEVVMSSQNFRTPEDMKVTDIIQMETARMLTLIRGWSLKQDIERMVQLDPIIIQAILHGVREEIGMKAIF